MKENDKEYEWDFYGIPRLVTICGSLPSKSHSYSEAVLGNFREDCTFA